MARRRKKADCWVHLNDEAPRIGSGRRGVTIVAIGRKWARIKETASGRPARIKRAVWEQIKPA